MQTVLLVLLYDEEVKVSAAYRETTGSFLPSAFSIILLGIFDLQRGYTSYLTPLTEVCVLDRVYIYNSFGQAVCYYNYCLGKVRGSCPGNHVAIFLVRSSGLL
jgi:hypothetical protein